MNLNNQKILVTGADGFIGSHLVEKLISQNFNVRSLVHYNSFGSYGWLDHLSIPRQDLEVIMGDIRDPFNSKTAMKGCDVVFHLAALVAIPYSYYSPATYVDTNIVGTLNLLQAAREIGVKKFVQTSTSEVYGTALYAPINEEHPLQGQSPYSASKIGADQMALAFFKSFNVPVSIIRPFNTYGPRQSLRAVIPTIICQALAEKDTIKLGNIATTRDFSFVEDTVQGFIEVAGCDACLGEVTNVGSGFEVSVRSTLEIIEKITGRFLSIQTEEERLRPEKSEVYRLIADISKAKKLFNWKPKFSGMEGLEEGLRKTVTWFSQKENMNKYQLDKYVI